MIGPPRAIPGLPYHPRRTNSHATASIFIVFIVFSFFRPHSWASSLLFISLFLTGTVPCAALAPAPSPVLLPGEPRAAPQHAAPQQRSRSSHRVSNFPASGRRSWHSLLSPPPFGCPLSQRSCPTWLWRLPP